MSAAEKPLSINQKILMEEAGKQAVQDWQHHLGNTRLLASRVLIAKMIRHGGEDVLSAVADHFGVRIIKSKDVYAQMDEIKKNRNLDYTYEQVEKILFDRMTHNTNVRKKNSHTVTTVINNQPVGIKIEVVSKDDNA